jgi:AcrR family transcriptional regulator
MREAARRDQILRAAEKLLGRYGAAKTTMADLAREAGVAVGSVYLEFSSKEAIVESLSMAKHRRVMDAMKKAAEGGGSFAERLTRIFDARTTVLLHCADEGAHACELVHCMSTAVRSAQARFAAEETTLLATLLGDGARTGELAVPNADATARAVLHAYSVFSPPHLFELPRDEVKSALRALHELVLRGVLSR